jgi:hypothetical protein
MIKTGLFMFAILFTAQLVAAGFHDPMRPPAYALEKYRQEKIKNNPSMAHRQQTQKKPDVWVLNSILYSAQRQHAIINNKLVRKGEKIAGAKLVALKPDSVKLIASGKIIELKLPGVDQSIKKSLNENKL